MPSLRGSSMLCRLADGELGKAAVRKCRLSLHTGTQSRGMRFLFERAAQKYSATIGATRPNACIQLPYHLLSNVGVWLESSGRIQRKLQDHGGEQASILNAFGGCRPRRRGVTSWLSLLAAKLRENREASGIQASLICGRPRRCPCCGRQSPGTAARPQWPLCAEISSKPAAVLQHSTGSLEGLTCVHVLAQA